MDSKMLFSDGERANNARKHSRESEFQFLDRSSSPDVAKVRDFFADAFSRYPESEHKEIISRLRSGNEAHFRSATFEVLLHELLLKLGYSLTPHPDPGTGEKTRPDFLVSAPNGESFFLEAVLATERDDGNRSAEQMKETALQALYQESHHDFVLEISSRGNPTTTPSSRKLLKHARTWLNSLDADAVRQHCAEAGSAAMPSTSFNHEGWTVTMRARPLALHQIGKAQHLVASLGYGAKRVNSWAPLRDAINKKAGRYGDVSKPLIVAVNADTFYLGEDSEIQALYGEEAWVANLERPEQGEIRHIRNGSWLNIGGVQNRRVSAVCFFNDLTPYRVARTRCNIYFNPWAKLKAPGSLQRLSTVQLLGENLVKSDGCDLRVIYGLPLGWPD